MLEILTQTEFPYRHPAAVAAVTQGLHPLKALASFRHCEPLGTHCQEQRLRLFHKISLDFPMCQSPTDPKPGPHKGTWGTQLYEGLQ